MVTLFQTPTQNRNKKIDFFFNPHRIQLTNLINGRLSSKTKKKTWKLAAKWSCSDSFQSAEDGSNDSEEKRFSRQKSRANEIVDTADGNNRFKSSPFCPQLDREITFLFHLEWITPLISIKGVLQVAGWGFQLSGHFLGQFLRVV